MGIGDTLKKGGKKVDKMFHRKSKDSASPPPSEASGSQPKTPNGGSGGGVTPGKPMLNVQAPPPKPKGGAPPDVSKVPGVDAQPKPAEGKGSSAPRPSAQQQESLVKGENTALAGEPDQAAKDQVAAKQGSPEGEVAASPLPPTPDDHIILATTVVLVRFSALQTR